MDRVILKASLRTTLGKKTKSLRRAGITPIHVYGPGGDTLVLQAPSEQVRVALATARRTNPVTISLEGGAEEVTLIRGVAHHAVTGVVQHVDFLRVDVNKPVEAEVPVVLQGDAPGIRGGAGFVTQGLYTIAVLAKPFEIPPEIVVDVSVLVDLSSVIRVQDLALPGGAEPLTDPTTMVAWIQLPRVVEEEVPLLGEEELEEAAGGEEGEAAPTEDGEAGAASEGDD